MECLQPLNCKENINQFQLYYYKLFRIIPQVKCYNIWKVVRQIKKKKRVFKFMIQMLFPSHLLNLLLVVDFRVHFLDNFSLDSLSKPFDLMTHAHFMFRIFNLNQSLGSRLIPNAYYIILLVCMLSSNVTRSNLNLPPSSQQPWPPESCPSPFQVHYFRYSNQKS